MKELAQALAAMVPDGALILIGPGAPDDLAPGVPRRHVPGGVLVPMAEGARLAAPNAPVVAVGGDGDIYGEGLGDLLHAVRRNTGVTCLVADNGIAGPHVATVGPGEYSLKPLAMAVAAGASFAAQETPGESLPGLVAEALVHPGFALVNIRNERGREHFDTGVLHRASERASFEAVVLGQAPLVTTVSTIEWDDWERILYGEAGEEDEDENGDDVDGAWA